ncbi:hypothetical protein GGR56DRAFT_545879 [Xylariaceae sp. FL0804]|nr:hypothetical protein GGR56DRAFT_545879 [Xylariaceae sp. FL0804]
MQAPPPRDPPNMREAQQRSGSLHELRRYRELRYPINRYGEVLQERVEDATARNSGNGHDGARFRADIRYFVQEDLSTYPRPLLGPAPDDCLGDCPWCNRDWGWRF